MRGAREAGYSLVEVMVSLTIFSVVSTAFVGVMMSGARSADTTRRNVRVSEEARLGLNRIVRDVREAGWIALPGTSPSTAYTSFTVKTDYNGNGAYLNSTGPAGTAESNYEVVTYAYDAAAGAITVTAEGFPTETLIKGVSQVNASTPIFSFTSNRLEYDYSAPNCSNATPDGVTELCELNLTACALGGYNTAMDSCNSVLVDKELANITNVDFAIKVTSEGVASEYFAEAQLRNRR